jgi:hypothetical protein
MVSCEKNPVELQEYMLAEAVCIRGAASGDRPSLRPWSAG